jgi:IS30 family transposase
MISRQSSSSLAVALERLSRRLHISKLPAKSARNLRISLNSRLGSHPTHLRKSITYDNGSENVEHVLVNKKGSVENAISLIRRFLPKKTNFAIITKEQVKQIESLLNNRPRKCLCYKTPNEIFNESVALAT